MASARAFVAAAGLLLWLMIRAPSALRIRAASLPLLIAYGVIGFAVFEVLFFATLTHTTVAVAVALLYTAPAFVLLLSWLTKDEPVEPRRLLPLALVIAGVFLVTGAASTLRTGDAPITATALVLGLGAGFTYALYTWFGKRALRRDEPTVVIFYVFAIAALVLAVPAPPWRITLDHPDAIPMLLLLGLIPTLFAYALYATALDHLPASTAAMLASIEPVLAALLGFLLLGEGMGADRWAGIAVVVAAAVWLSKRA